MRSKFVCGHSSIYHFKKRKEKKKKEKKKNKIKNKIKIIFSKIYFCTSNYVRGKFFSLFINLSTEL